MEVLILAPLSILCAIIILSLSQKDYQKIVKEHYNMSLFQFIFKHNPFFPKLTTKVYIGLFVGMIIGLLLSFVIGFVIFYLRKTFGFHDDLYLKLITITSENGSPGVEVSDFTVFIFAFIFATLATIRYFKKSINTLLENK